MTTAAPASPRPPPIAPGPRSGGAGWDRLADAALAMAVAAVAVSSVVTDDPTVAEGLFPEPTPALVLLALLGSVPLALRRRWPLAVHAVVLAAVFTIGALGWNTGLVAACPMFSLYTVAAWRPLRVAVPALVAQYAVTAGLGLLGAPYFADLMGQVATLGYAIVWLVGLYVRRTRRQRRAAIQRALEAERTRAVTAERAVFAERLRIARELHDVVAHTLSVIAVQSGVARHLVGNTASPATPALTAIEQASRSALDDLRRLLGVLRADPGDPPAALSPSPGLDDLRLLVSAHQQTYGQVELTIDSDLDALPDSLRLTVFRLVQEGLTNVRKHAPGTTSRVTVRTDDRDIVVEISNDGPAAHDTPDGQSGFGLAGMRERVAMFEGTLEAGPCPDGGFRVRATLHTHPHDSTVMP